MPQSRARFGDVGRLIVALVLGRLIVALVLAAGLLAFAWLAWPLSMVLFFALALAFN